MNETASRHSLTPGAAADNEVRAPASLAGCPMPDGEGGGGDILDAIMNALLVQSVLVFARLRLADELDAGPATAEELAQRIGANPAALARLLAATTSFGVVSSSPDGHFQLTPLGRQLCEGPDSPAAFARFIGEPWAWAAWGELEHAVITGECGFRAAHGAGVFEWFGQHGKEMAVFQQWMTANSRRQAKAVTDAYDFSQFASIVDVGGGHGGLLQALILAYPNLRGVLFDTPGVIGSVPPLDERVRLQEGDFFEAAPPAADCYLLKLVLHDWDDDRAERILDNVRAAMRPDSTVLVIESVLPEGDGYHRARFVDLNMLVFADGGRERTEPEYARLFERAGLELAAVHPTTGPMSLLEGRPARQSRRTAALAHPE